MALKNGANTGLFSWGLPGEGHYDALMRQYRWIDFFLNPNVKNTVLSTPPGTPADGDAYIVGAAPTGAWAAHAKHLARWTTDLTTPAWEFMAPKEGSALVYNLTDKKRYQYTGTEWIIFASGGGGGGGGAGGGSGDLIMAASDMTTEIVTGVSVAYVPASRAGTIVGVKANLRVASTSGSFAINIKKNGTSILSTPLTIDATETTSLTAAVAAVVSDDEVAADDLFTVDVTGAGVGARGLIVTLLFLEDEPPFYWNPQTTSYTVELGDVSNGISMGSDTAATITIPPSASVAFKEGSTILVAADGVGVVTIVAGAGVTIRSRGDVYAIAGQYGMATLVQREADVWYLSGDLA